MNTERLYKKLNALRSQPDQLRDVLIRFCESFGDKTTRYGQWTALWPVKQSKMFSVCDCGTLRDVSIYSLKNGASTSCGHAASVVTAPPPKKVAKKKKAAVKKSVPSLSAKELAQQTEEALPLTIYNKTRPLGEWLRMHEVTFAEYSRRLKEGWPAEWAARKVKSGKAPSRMLITSPDGKTLSVSDWASIFGLSDIEMMSRIRKAVKTPQLWERPVIQAAPLAPVYGSSEASLPVQPPAPIVRKRYYTVQK